MSYHYGQIIRRYRLQHGLSQAELAERWPKADGTAGVSTLYVQDIEDGYKHITHPATLHHLATILDIPLWEFGLAEYDPFHATTSSEALKANESEEAEEREEKPESAAPIPSAYYERMLHAYTQLEPALLSWTTWNLGLMQLRSQLGSVAQQHAQVSVVKCSPPSPLVRTVHEIVRSHPSLPQAVNLRFAGRESFAGRAIQEGKTLLEAQRCAVPIRRYTCISACLVVQLQTEIRPSEVAIVQRYADLFALAFSPQDFYSAQSIDLYTIPDALKQERVLQEFDLQRLDLVSFSLTNPERIRQAERLIMQHLLVHQQGGADVSVS